LIAAHLRHPGTGTQPKPGLRQVAGPSYLSLSVAASVTRCNLERACNDSDLAKRQVDRPPAGLEICIDIAASRAYRKNPYI
jgi:hypothetical protein